MSAVVAAENPLTRKLWHIAGSGDLEQLEQLLNQGADVNAGDRTGVTALMRAAYHGQLTMVRALIERGADPNARDRSGLSALTMAKHAGHQEIVETLVCHGAEGNKAKPRRLVSVADENISLPVVKPEPVREVIRAETRAAHEPIHEANHEATHEPSREAINAATISRTPTVRTLQEPPDIWDLVQTTQPESASLSVAPRKFAAGKLVERFATRRFLPGSFTPGKFVSRRALMMGAAAVFICAGVAFGFLFWRGTGNALEEPEERTEAASLEAGSAVSQRTSNAKAMSEGRVRSSRLTRDLAKVRSVGRLGEPTRPSAPPVLASAVLPARKPSAKPRPETTASFSRQNRNLRNTTRGESDQGASPKSARKEQSPASNDSVPPTVTQKPKVIQWP